MGYGCLTKKRKGSVVNVVGPVESGDEGVLWLRNPTFRPWGKSVDNHQQLTPLSTPINRYIVSVHEGVGGCGERPDKNRACQHLVHRSQRHIMCGHAFGKARVVRDSGQ